MNDKIIETLITLTYRNNDDVKIAAIESLGEYTSNIAFENVINRLIELARESNRDVAIAAIKSLGKILNLK